MHFPDRYTRQIKLRGFGTEAQQKLQNASVLVVGAGGLGVPALQYLAGMGIGTIGIADGDKVGMTNLNRQVLYYEAEVGLSKATVASNKLALQNSSITIKAFDTFLSVENAIQIIADFDLVIDATDNFAARYLINDACVILGKPFIYGAIQEYEGHVSVFNYEEGPTYRCLYPDFPTSNEIPDCNTAGVLGVVPGIIGCQQALEAVKVITGVGRPASGYLRIFDFLENDQYEVKLKANPENRHIQNLKVSYAVPVCTTIPTLQVHELYHWFNSGQKFLLVDVREKQEYEMVHLENSLLSPLSTFSAVTLPFVDNVPVVFCCQQGGRSMRAASMLRERFEDIEVYSMEGGIARWQEEIGSKLLIS